jgi:hypothetical protein
MLFCFQYEISEKLPKTLFLLVEKTARHALNLLGSGREHDRLAYSFPSAA